MPAAITAVECTDLFAGPQDAPRQILRVTYDGPGAPVHVTGPGVRGAADGEIPDGGSPDAVRTQREQPQGPVTVEVPLEITGHRPGAVVPVVVTAGERQQARAEAEITVAEPGWTVFMVPHFHYDPVWWNTEAAYCAPSPLLSGDGSTRPLWRHNAFALIDAHLDLALRDPEYRIVLAEVDYLKPYFDTHPERRAVLRELMRGGRVELVGGTYNEPSTNLTGAEATIRNIVLGVGYQRDILGGDPRTAWQLDVFGHDPQFPGHLAAAGLTASAWARGPFHQWGPIQKNFGPAKDDASVMQFASEFEWLSSSGRGVLTHYMPHHYSAGWWMDDAPDLAAAEQAVYALYRKLKPVAATRNVLLPVGTDFTPPNRWVTAIHRSWAGRYVWPRFVCALPRDFLDAVRAEYAASRRRPSPQSRDMNPVYTGKDVSYADTKQAQRAGEAAAVDAEKLATLAALQGLGRYPDAALDKVWRQLAYGAHHDAITGSESDQVYLDLLTGWRDAYDLATAVRDRSLDALTGAIRTAAPAAAGEATAAVVVTNTLSFARSDVVAVRLPGHLAAALGADLAGCTVLDDTGAVVPSAVERGVLHFRADTVPALGWRTWRLAAHRPPGPAAAAGPEAAPPGPRTAPAPPAAPAPAPGTAAPATGPVPLWQPAEGCTAAAGRYRVTADPARGGGLSSVRDLACGRELIRTGQVGNELRVYEEYPQHPDFGEGPWHLVPTGSRVGAADGPAQVRRETGPLGERLLITGTVDGIDYEQTVTLWHGVDRVAFRTRLLGHTGADQLVRVRFPVDLPGTLPVSEVAGAVIGRGFALPDADSAEAPWTLDNPAHTWFGVSSTARADLTGPAGEPLGARALGVAEIVVPTADDAADARDLVVALARAGVTATTGSADRARYGWLDVDSNLPDARIVVGGPGVNPAAREILRRAGAAHRAVFAAHGRVWIPAQRPLSEVWQPGADLRDLRALPALVVADAAELVADLADARVSAVCAVHPPAGEVLTDHTAALLNTGMPGFAVDPAGALHLSLMRSCTGWPSGVWIDPPRRTAPDGSSFQLQHWTHEFDYALVSGDGDWRALALPSRGQEVNHPLYARVLPVQDGPLPAARSWLSVEPAREVLLTALKPTGNPVARGSARASEPARGITLRLTEATGLGRTAVLGGALGLDRPQAADLLEQPTGGPADLDLPGADIVTVTAVPRVAPQPGGPLLGPAAETVQPVHARYWLHNRGPAPLGGLPVSVTASPELLHTRGESVAITAVLASQLVDRDIKGTLDVRVPDGWHASAATGPFRLDAGGHAHRTVHVTPPPDTPAGLYFVAVRAAYDGADYEGGGDEGTGHPGCAEGRPRVEDVVTVAVGDAGGLLPAPGEPPEDWTAAQGTTATGEPATGLTAEVLSTSVRAEPGGLAALELLLTNTTRDEIRGELHVVSPWGTWQAIADPVRAFAVPAGARKVVAFDITPPADAEPGAYWALVKVMWFGRVQYTPAVPLRIAP